MIYWYPAAGRIFFVYFMVNCISRVKKNCQGRGQRFDLDIRAFGQLLFHRWSWHSGQSRTRRIRLADSSHLKAGRLFTIPNPTDEEETHVCIRSN